MAVADVGAGLDVRDGVATITWQRRARRLPVLLPPLDRLQALSHARRTGWHCGSLQFTHQSSAAQAIVMQCQKQSRNGSEHIGGCLPSLRRLELRQLRQFFPAQGNPVARRASCNQSVFSRPFQRLPVVIIPEASCSPIRTVHRRPPGSHAASASSFHDTAVGCPPSSHCPRRRAAS